MVKESEIPEGWGLLEISGRGVRKIKEAPFLGVISHRSERSILISSIRRIGQLTPTGIFCKAYYNEEFNSEATTVTLTIDKNIALEEAS